MKTKSTFLSVFLMAFMVVSCAHAQPAAVSSTNTTDPEIVLTTGHNDQINDLAISANGKYLASGSNNNVVKIWDIATSREFRAISDCDGRIVTVKWSPDNIHMAALLYSDEIKVWNVITGENVAVFKASASSRSFDFVNNGKAIVYPDDDSNLSIGQVFIEEEPKHFKDVYVMMVSSNDSKKESYVLDNLGNFVTVDFNTGTIKKKWAIFEKMNFPFSAMKLDPNTGLIACGFNDDKVYVVDVPKEKIVFKSKKMKSKIQDVAFRHKNSTIYVSDHIGNVLAYNFKTGKEIYNQYVQFKRVQKLAFHPNGSYLVQASHDILERINPENGEILQTIKGSIGKMHKMSLSPTGRYLAAAKTKTTIDVWDLNQNRVVSNLKGFFPCQFASDGTSLFSMSYLLKIVMWDVKTQKELKTFDTESELIQVLAVSKDGKYLAGAGFLGVIKVWDIESGKLIKKLTGHAGGIYGLDFSNDGSKLASSGMDMSVRIWDFKNGKEIKKISDQQIVVSDVQFSPDDQLLASASWDKTIKLYNTSDWSLKNTLEGHISVVHDIDFSADGKYLASSGGNSVVTKSDNSVIVWDVESGSKRSQYRAHTDHVFRVEFDGNSHRLYSGSNDGTFAVYDADKKEKLALMMSTNNSEFLLLTPDNYYMGSKSALKSVSFRIGDKLYPLEQFDLRLNRPDIVAKRIGKSPQGLINAYEYIHKKRLKKMGIKEEDLDGGFNLPTIEFLDKTKIPVVSKEEFLTLNYKASDTKYKLDRINVYVNGVPVYGLKGIDVKSSSSSQLSNEIKVPLLEGNNEIQISCLNSAGSESLMDRVRVIRETGKTKSNLYLVTIGVSEYKDDRFNLTYPSKDANDVMSSLKTRTELYQNIFVKELINGDATRENILKLKEFLAQANPSDAVMIFVAGHGVLDENFDYFFGTHDMDFNDPSAHGLPYEILENMLSETKAIKKLLIMDTCHSGEVDKDDIERNNDEPEPDGDVEFRAAGAGVREKEGIGVDNSVELMQDLFSDLRKGSGATVISSAGGAEYAMESAEWKNGLFTYCLLKGMKNMEADYNKDNFVQISEIRKYVYETVSQLSDGKQRPTARRENINLDYRVY